MRGMWMVRLPSTGRQGRGRWKQSWRCSIATRQKLIWRIKKAATHQFPLLFTVEIFT